VKRSATPGYSQVVAPRLQVTRLLASCLVAVVLAQKSIEFFRVELLNLLFNGPVEAAVIWLTALLLLATVSAHELCNV